MDHQHASCVGGSPWIIVLYHTSGRAFVCLNFDFCQSTLTGWRWDPPPMSSCHIQVVCQLCCCWTMTSLSNEQRQPIFWSSTLYCGVQVPSNPGSGSRLGKHFTIPKPLNFGKFPLHAVFLRHSADLIPWLSKCPNRGGLESQTTISLHVFLIPGRWRESTVSWSSVISILSFFKNSHLIPYP